MQPEDHTIDLSQALAAVTSVFGPVVLLEPGLEPDPRAATQPEHRSAAA